ncbi:MAG: hypothetical protein ACXWM7_06135 [Parachlamydiaceae bacterium]
MSLITESYNYLVGFYERTGEKWIEAFLQIQTQKALSLPDIFERYVNSLTSLDENARAKYQELNVANLRGEILNIKEKERIALKSCQSGIGHLYLSALLAGVLSVSSLAVAIFVSFSLAIILAVAAGLVGCYGLYYFAPHFFPIIMITSIAGQQLANQFRPFHSWFKDTGIPATPEIKNILSSYRFR